MGQIIFSEVGAVLGRQFLGAGFSLAGRQISGALIGRTAGALLGRAIDTHFAAPAEGPRLTALPIMDAGEGRAMPAVYGRMRIGGQLIWAARFREQAATRRAGGKGGPRVREYSYSLSFAVALGEGPVTRIVRAWANGEPFDLSGAHYRFYPGDGAQAPDPLISLIEGAAPAYRGVAYIVFEDLPLDAFGNRVPNFSFEIIRPAGAGDGTGLGETVRAVNIIPASGEFAYATQIVREPVRPGFERPLNAHSGEARADFLVSLDQLREDLPLVTDVALVTGWFGTSLSAGDCRILPGVEIRERKTLPQDWQVAGQGRGSAYLISQDEAGRPNYGGTPDDASVIAAISELKARGYGVTLTPFLFMDAPGFPWRGRISVAADGTAAARAEIDQFVDGAEGYRAFILHHAALAAEAGGVEAFLIGSEMRGLTRLQDEAGAFPFVEALCALAAEVKAILPGAKVSYAADWTEYGAYVPQDGSGDVLFPLDALWAHPGIDFVGIDWYPPAGDWREGEAHHDRLAGYPSADDPAYLAAQMAGGEGYDWFYADDAARAAQARTPIVDTAHGENWVFRVKDLEGWSANLHYPRPGGVRAAEPTGWTPGLKPIRLSEIGFAAVDKGGNAPNLFFDPKSSESALPPFSSGARDDLFQRAALAAALAHHGASPLVEKAYVWAWDGRPFPAWPLKGDVWGDGGNWARGHWLNGRTGAAPLRDVVADICARGGVTDVDAGALDGLVQGYAPAGVQSVRSVLEPLLAAFCAEAIERDGRIIFRMADDGPVSVVDPALAGEAGLIPTRRMMEKAPQRLRLHYTDPAADYQPAVAEARTDAGDPRLVMDLAMPLALGAAQAEAVAGHLLARAQSAEAGELTLPLAGLALEPGDGLRLGEGEAWRISETRDGGAARALVLEKRQTQPPRVRAAEAGAAAPPAPIYSGLDLVVIDAPHIPGRGGEGPLVAAWAEPWPGDVRIEAGPDTDALTERAVLTRRAVINRLTAPLPAGPVGRWDRAGHIELFAPEADMASLSVAAVFGGGNTALLETAEGWELLQFRVAELTGPGQWRLSHLLRGQSAGLSGAAPQGARLVLLDMAVLRAAMSPDETGLSLAWRAAGYSVVETHIFGNEAALAWPVCHLRRRGGEICWLPRGPDIPDNWDLPDPPASRTYAVEWDFGSGFGARTQTSQTAAAIPAGAIAARVAAIGPDGRLSRWLSIPAGSP